MDFSGLMTLASSIPGDVAFASSKGMWVAIIAVLSIAVCGILSATPLGRTPRPRARALRIVEVPAAR